MQPDWTRIAAYVVCRDDAGRLLLTRLTESGMPSDGMWTMPGGGMDWGETPLETAIRELDEETGLSATIGPLVGVKSRWFTAEESWRNKSGHSLGLIYEAQRLEGELRTEFDEGSTDAAAWFTLDEVRQLPRVDLVDFVLDLL